MDLHICGSQPPRWSPVVSASWYPTFGWPPPTVNRADFCMGIPRWWSGKESTCNAGDAVLIPVSKRSPGGEHGNPLQYYCLENPMDRGAWQLQSMVSQGDRHDWSNWTHTSDQQSTWKQWSATSKARSFKMLNLLTCRSGITCSRGSQLPYCGNTQAIL